MICWAQSSARASARARIETYPTVSICTTTIGSARASARARIETNCTPSLAAGVLGSARASARARIETCRCRERRRCCRVAPAPRRGRGLKRVGHNGDGGSVGVAPAPRRGRGLKQTAHFTRIRRRAVAPAPRRGRGLKRSRCMPPARRSHRSARASARARIETISVYATGTSITS